MAFGTVLGHECVWPPVCMDKRVVLHIVLVGDLMRLYVILPATDSNL